MSNKIRTALVGSGVMNVGQITTVPPNFNTILSGSGYYVGVVDGSTKYGDVKCAGQLATPPRIAADWNRRSLSINGWMSEFFNTTSNPVGHGFTPQMVNDGFACYTFHPRANVPLKVIVLDDTDKLGGGAAASLDIKRYNWLVHELDKGEAAGELMIICAHIPLRPYDQVNYNGTPSHPTNLSPLWSLWDPYSEISEDTLLAQLHTYKNLILWCSGHVHRNAITPQPAPPSASFPDGDPEYGFWEVETSSLRDFPQQFRRFEIVFNSDRTISIFALDVDVAVNPTPLTDGSGGPPWPASPALTSRSYAIATNQIFQNYIQQGPNIDPDSGVYNAELIKQLSPEMQVKLANLAPVLKVKDGLERLSLNDSIHG